MAYSLRYSYDSATQSYSVTGYSNITTADNVVIPSTYNDGTNGEHPVTSIGNNAFYECSTLTRVKIPDSVKSIGINALARCTSLTSIVIPDSVTSIGEGSLARCTSLTSVTIPDSITNLSDWVFNECNNLTIVSIGNGVTDIKRYVFRDCPKLKTIILFPETPPTLGSTYAIPKTTTIYVPQSSKEAYKTATNWAAFANKIESDNLYLSFVRFNQKNKEYIDEKILEATEAILARITALENK